MLNTVRNTTEMCMRHKGIQTPRTDQASALSHQKHCHQHGLTCYAHKASVSSRFLISILLEVGLDSSRIGCYRSALEDRLERISPVTHEKCKIIIDLQNIYQLCGTSENLPDVEHGVQESPPKLFSQLLLCYLAEGGRDEVPRPPTEVKMPHWYRQE